MGMLDTHVGLIIPYLLIDMPLAFLLSASFIASVPKELDEAALVDGCTRFTAFWKVILPLSLPGLLVTFAFCFMFAWNEYLFALLISGTRVITLPVHITSYLSIHSIGWGEVAALGMIITMPMLILLIAIQKYLVKGLTLGALQ
jgi:multiple sugar transport system permease protein